jgi:excisionase family DNA binding protein
MNNKKEKNDLNAKITPNSKDEFISVRDVSGLLHINEKKVYTLAQEGKIPGTKVTGKWLFPRRELEELMRIRATQPLSRFSEEYAPYKNVVLLAGSDDPAIGMVQGLLHTMYPEYVFFSASVGSGEGLRLLKNNYCHIALSHLFDQDTEDFNFPFIGKIFDHPEELVLMNLFFRNVGFVSKQGAVGNFNEIARGDLRFINRQKKSGIRNRIEEMLREEGLPVDRIAGFTDEVYTHLDVAAHIVAGKADVGIAAESVAYIAGLHFHKLFEERFDMVIQKKNFFEKNIQVFIEFIRSSSFLSLLKSMRGYDPRETGKILYPRSI